MKKSEIILLVNAGVQAITNHDLSTEHAYKVVKFRKAINNAYEAIAKDEETLRKDAGIDDPQSFDNELKELREKAKPYKDKNEEIPSEIGGPLMEKETTLSRFFALRAELLKEEVTLDCKAMPYEEWHKLQNENKAVGEPKRDLLSGFVEDLLEGVLWVAPEDKD